LVSRIDDSSENPGITEKSDRQGGCNTVAARQNLLFQASRIDCRAARDTGTPHVSMPLLLIVVPLAIPPGWPSCSPPLLTVVPLAVPQSILWHEHAFGAPRSNFERAPVARKARATEQPSLGRRGNAKPSRQPSRRSTICSRSSGTRRLRQGGARRWRCSISSTE
jgi:hypothetical protein